MVPNRFQSGSMQMSRIPTRFQTGSKMVPNTFQPFFERAKNGVFKLVPGGRAYLTPFGSNKGLVLWRCPAASNGPVRGDAEDGEELQFCPSDTGAVRDEEEVVAGLEEAAASLKVP